MTTARTPVRPDRITGSPGDFATAVIAAALSESCPNDGSVFIVVNNGSGAPITLTVSWGAAGVLDNSGQGGNGVAPAAKTFSIPATDTMIIGPFPKLPYNDANGLLQLAYSAIATVKTGYFTCKPE